MSVTFDSGVFTWDLRGTKHPPNTTMDPCRIKNNNNRAEPKRTNLRPCLPTQALRKNQPLPMADSLGVVAPHRKTAHSGKTLKLLLNPGRSPFVFLYPYYPALGRCRALRSGGERPDRLHPLKTLTKRYLNVLNIASAMIERVRVPGTGP